VNHLENNLKTILVAIEENKEELIEFVKEIVRIPSYSGQEEAVAKVIAKWMHEFEFDNVMTDELGSVIGCIEGKVGNDHLLLFDAHMDHVDIGRRDVWDFEPFGAIVKDNAIYGRGVVDMKGALASQIFALGMIRRYGITPPTDLCMAAVVFEELHEGLAVKHIIEDIGITPNCVILGEPSNLNLSVGQRGRAEIEIITKGKTSHGSMPELGKNAIYPMTWIINEIIKLNERLPSHPFLGKGSVTIIDISSSPGGNVVPDKCRIVVDRRIIPKETEEVVLNEIENVLDMVKEQLSDFEFSFSIIDDPVKFTNKTLINHKFFPTWYFEPSMPLIQTAKTVLEKAVGQQVEVIKWLFSTDGVYTAGIAKLPSIGFGPGEEEQAHTPNEHLAIDQLVTSAKGYAALALSLISK